MIKGKTQNIKPKKMKNYRDLDALNYSSIKTYLQNPKKFYNEFILKEKRIEKDNFSLSLGSLVDNMLVTYRGDYLKFETNFDKEFSLFEDKKGTGQAFILADYLYEITEKSIIDGRITSPFLERFERAFEKTQKDGKYNKKTMDWALEDFNNSEALKWFEQKLLSRGKKLVDLSVISKAKYMVEKVINDENISSIIKNENLIDHFIIEWEYECLFGDTIKCKSELDWVIFDEVNKNVEIIDNKISWESENFSFAYLKYKYYLQAAFYYLALRWWCDNNGKEDYNIIPPKFLVEDSSSDNLKPLLYELTEEDLNNGLNGFYINGKKYEGVRGAIEEINWAIKNEIFDISKENYENNNKAKLNLKYD